MVMRSHRVLITGAAGVLGRACCERQLELGHRVVAVDVDPDAGNRLINDLGAGDQLTLVVADVRDETAVEKYVAVATETMGGIDGFFNNAGIEGTVAPITDQELETFDQVVAVNLRGVFLGLKHVMPAMAAAGGGSIVNIASVAGMVGIAGLSPYVTTKHAVVGLTKVAALEGAAAGIRVNVVCPGPITSRMMESLEHGAADMLGLPDSSIAHDAYVGLVPTGRYGTASEVAAVVAFLLSDDAPYISGAAIPVDGAFTAQ